MVVLGVRHLEGKGAVFRVGDVRIGEHGGIVEIGFFGLC